MPSWTRIHAPELPHVPVFAHAAVAGDHVYVSGTLGLKDDFSAIVPGGVAAETRKALHHVERILAACDASLADIVKVSVYMTDLAEWGALNEIYMEVFGDQTPARIAVGVDALLLGASIELDCIAYRQR